MSKCSSCGNYHSMPNYKSNLGKKYEKDIIEKILKSYGKKFIADYDGDKTNINKPISKLDNVIFYNDDLDSSLYKTVTFDFENLYPSILNKKKYSHNSTLSISIKMSDLHLYEAAELYEYIKILASENKLGFWDLFKLEEIHNMSLIENIKNTPEPSDDIIYRITI